MTGNKSFVQAGEYNSSMEYKSFFGNVEENTCYLDPLGTAKGNKMLGLKSNLKKTKDAIVDASGFKFDARAELNMAFKSRAVEMKALTAGIGGAGTTDTVLNPFSLDPEMWDLSRRELPARTLMRRVSNFGPKAVWNTLDDKGNSVNSDAFYGELQPNEFTDSTYSRSSTDIKLLRRGGVTTGFAQATQPSFINQGFNYTAGADGQVGTFTDQTVANAIDRNVVERTKALMEDEEWAIFNGDSSTNALEFDGIIKIIGTTNTVDKNSTAVALVDFRTATTNARQDGGYIDIAYTDLITYDDVIGLIQATKQGIVDYGEETEYGFNYVKLRTGAGVIKLIGSQFLTTTTNLKAVWLLDSRTWEMRVVQDITFMPMGRTIDGDSFIVKMYEALVCKAIQFNASITEIA
jgi:hypothetical protein